MAKRDSFLVRLDPRILAALRQWADDEMRSVNGQIEYLLRNNLQSAGRLSAEKEKRKSSESQAKSD